MRAHAAITCVADLGQHECLVNAAFHGAPWRLSNAGQVTQVQVAGRLTVNSSESLRVAVLAGMGVALLPTFAIANDLRDGRLQAVLPEHAVEGPFGSSVHAVFSPSKFVAPKMRVFVDFLVAQFASGAPWRQA